MRPWRPVIVLALAWLALGCSGSERPVVEVAFRDVTIPPSGVRLRFRPDAQAQLRLTGPPGVEACWEERCVPLDGAVSVPRPGSGRAPERTVEVRADGEEPVVAEELALTWQCGDATFWAEGVDASSQAAAVRDRCGDTYVPSPVVALVGGILVAAAVAGAVWWARKPPRLLP